MMIQHGDDSSSNSTDLFSPGQARAASLVNAFTPTPKAIDNVGTKNWEHHGQAQASSSSSSSSSAAAGGHSHDTLPRLHDNSWLGAKVSPIQSEDEDDDNNDDDENAARDFDNMLSHETMKGTSTSFLGATEETTLLGRSVTNQRGSARLMRQSQPLLRPLQQPRWQQQQQQHHHGFSGTTSEGGGGTGIGYPMPLEEAGNLHMAAALRTGRTNGGLFGRCQEATRRFWLSRHALWAPPFCSSAFLFGIVGLHDAYFAYLSYRRGVPSTYSLAWSLPWGRPSDRSLLRFGAFSVQRLMGGKEYWRCLTSFVWATSSVVEWILVVIAWWVLERTVRSKVVVQERELQQQGQAAAPFAYHPTYQPLATPMAVAIPTDASLDVAWWLWPTTYVLSSLTGQLWMVAFGETAADADEGEDVTGCIAWGTAGVVCAMGILWPGQRFRLFLLAIPMVVISQLEGAPSAVFGTVGASFFGWFLGGSVGLSLSSSTGSPRRYYTEDPNDKGSVHGKNARNWDRLGGILSILVLVSLWVFPTIYIFRFRDYSES